MRNRISALVLVLTAFLFISWGGTGHRIISSSIEKFFTSEMEEFSTWVSFITDHASDADYRKDEDPAEGPKHYLDLDYYYEFYTTGKISMDLQELISKYGAGIVEDNGYLPWATLNTYGSLVKYLELGNIEKAKVFAADLGHYVADGHMPLHLTINFNGQITNNDGIHYRYESQMINKFTNEIDFEGVDINLIEDLDEYVFNYMYENYIYVDSLLLADDYAKSVSSDTNSDAYTTALWEKTSGFTVMLFRKASKVFTELLYNAWVDAGKPSLITSLEETEVIEASRMEFYPNPVKNFGKIEYSIERPSKIDIRISSSDGKISQTLISEFKRRGNYSLDIFLDHYPSGLYFLSLSTRNQSISRKLLIID